METDAATPTSSAAGQSGGPIFQRTQTRFARPAVIMAFTCGALLIFCIWRSSQYSDSLDISPLVCTLSRTDGAYQDVEISIRNNSLKPATLGAIITSCGCTTPRHPVQPTVISPGDVYNLSVAVNVPPFGQKTSKLTVTDSFGKTHEIAFLMNGIHRELPFLDSDQQRLDLTGDEYGKPCESSFVFRTVESPDSVKPWITSIRTASARVLFGVDNIGHKPTLEGVERTYRANVSLPLVEHNEGARLESLFLVDRDGKDTGICVAVAQCTFRNDLSVVPTDLVFSLESKKRFVIRSAKGELPEAMQIVPSVEWLETEVIHRNDGYMVVEVYNSDLPPSGTLLRGTILVRSINLGQPDLSVAVVRTK